jgi:large subunit ribosomal protein L9
MANQLLLIEDVENLGRSGDIVHVRPGYARNFLLPQGYAVVADKNALRMQTRLQEERKKKAIVDKQEADTMAAQLSGVVISTTVKVDHEGHMYGSVTVHDIVALFADQAKVNVEKRDIVLKHAIKTLGEHKITIKLKEGVTADVILDVISEDPKFFIVKETPEVPAAE